MNVPKTLIILFLVLIMAGVIGCYKQIPFEKSGISAELKVVDLDEPLPSQDEADIIITTHIKKPSYLLSPRRADTLYTFTLSIDNLWFTESLKGVGEVESDMDQEQGKGIHYIFKKRIRLKPGKYDINMKAEDGRSARVNVELAGGSIHDLKFDPVYGSNKSGFRKTFWHGVVDYKVYLDGNEILKQ